MLHAALKCLLGATSLKLRRALVGRANGFNGPRPIFVELAALPRARPAHPWHKTGHRRGAPVTPTPIELNLRRSPAYAPHIRGLKGPRTRRAGAAHADRVELAAGTPRTSVA